MDGPIGQCTNGPMNEPTNCPMDLMDHRPAVSRLQRDAPFASTRRPPENAPLNLHRPRGFLRRELDAAPAGSRQTHAPRRRSALSGAGD